MKIKSADKETANYPLRRELTPVFLGIALSVSGYAGSSIGVEQMATAYHVDINDTKFPYKTEYKDLGKHQSNNSLEQVIQRGYKVDTAWEKWGKVEKSIVLGYIPATIQVPDKEIDDAKYKSGAYLLPFERDYELKIDEEYKVTK